MANTVPILNFTNTFGDLLAQQNRQSVELNNLAANNYTKDSGTLILNGSGTGLSVTAAAILGSAIVANTTSLIGDVTALANVFINGAGFALDVTGSANIRQNTITNNLTSNNIVRTTTVNASGNVFANDITSNNSIRAVSIVSSGNTTVNTLRSNTSILGSTLNITGFSQTNSLKSNTLIDGSTLIISSLSTTNQLQSNNSVNTAIVTATNIIIGNNIQANTGLSSTTLSVSGLSSVGSLQANNSVNTATATVTGTTFTNLLQANSSINTATISVTGAGFVNTLQANSSVNTSIITASDIIIGRNIQANTGLNSFTLSVSGGTFANTIVANTSVTVPTLTVTSRLDANSAPVAFFNNIQTTGQVSVGGNFVINGTTVYSTNTFTINAGSAVGQISSFNVNRGISGANASIRWNEPQGYWDIRDVDNSTSFSKILTANLISDSLISTSSDTFASSLAANTLNNAISSNVAYINGVDVTQNTNITAVNNFAVSSFNRANTSLNQIIGTTGSANSIFGITTITSTNGVTIAGAANTITINTPQDLRTSSSPIFNALILTNALSITQGGTGATSSGAALTNLLPTASGVPAGFVLATNGPGTYYWAAGGTGGGGGAGPGTTIQSTRLTYTGNGTTTAYTAPTYIPGASQLRVYFDGVRQFASAYTETNATTVTFGTAPSSGVIILIEIDGYIDNPYFANNITFTAPFGGIVSTANTIQLAIQDLETRKAALSAASFTGSVTGVTVNTNASNTAFATTAFVKNSLNNSNTYTHSISGNAATATNAVNSTNLVAGGTVAGTVTGVTQAVNVNNLTLATTGFVRSIIPAGIILMWSGSIASIPGGWLLCNGTNGTPDLRDRFIVGAGSTYAVNATGGANSVTLDATMIPSHTHSLSASGTTASVNLDHTHSLSASGTTGGHSNDHSHSGTTSAVSNDHNHTFSGTTAGMNQNVTHSHGYLRPVQSNAANPPGSSGSTASAAVTDAANIDHAHTFSGTTSGISANHTHTVTTGGVSANHNHTVTVTGTSGAMSTNAAHSHTVTVTGTSGSTGGGLAHENRPPYYALAYIMKS